MDLTAAQKPAGNKAKKRGQNDAVPLCDTLSVAQIVTEILLLFLSSGLTHSVGINCDFRAKE